MTIKKFAFEVQSSLSKAHGIDLKRSHVHEVLAALFGFASYSALSTQPMAAHVDEGLPSPGSRQSRPSVREATTASALIGPVTNWSMSSFGIDGITAAAAMAAFVVFLLVGIHAPVGHAMPRTQNTDRLVAAVQRLQPVVAFGELTDNTGKLTLGLVTSPTMSVSDAAIVGRCSGT